MVALLRLLGRRVIDARLLVGGAAQSSLDALDQQAVRAGHVVGVVTVIGAIASASGVPAARSGKGHLIGGKESMC